MISPLSIEDPILDLGCGDGLFSKMLFLGMRKEIIGSDFSESCLNSAKSHGIYKGVSRCNGIALPYKNKSFATVLCNCVLEHIIDDEEVLLEVSRILQDRGLFIFTVPSKNFIPNLLNQRAPYIEMLNKRLEHFHYRSLLDWRNLLEECGLTLETHRYFLPKHAQQVWERLMRPLLRQVLARELCSYLGSRKTGMYFILRALVPIVFGRLLRKCYTSGTIDDGECGALLIAARR